MMDRFLTRRRAPLTLKDLYILGILIGLSGLMIRWTASFRIVCTYQAKARYHLDSLATGIDAFRADVGRYPTSLDELIVEPIGASGWFGPYVFEGGRSLRGAPYRYVQFPGDSEVPFAVCWLGVDDRIGGERGNRDVWRYGSPRK